MAKFWLYILGAVIAWYPILASGYLNVFISHREVMKLMGLEADLFYVHEGSINTYAMSFTVPVPADIHDLEFSWQSLTSYPLPYIITINYEADQEALAQPTINIPMKGYVPRDMETFVLHLPCTGKLSGQVPLSVHMLVEGPPRTNDTLLNFSRNKICLKGLSPLPNKSLAPAEAPLQRHAVLGAAACALSLVLVLALIASVMFVRARKQIRQDSLHTSFTTAAYGSQQNVFIRLDPLGRPPSANSGSYATIASLNKYPLESKKSCNIFDRFRGSPTPSPYATALLPMGAQGADQITETIYSKADSICPSRISYYASSQLTQVYSMSTPKSTRGGGGGSSNGIVCGNASAFGGASTVGSGGGGGGGVGDPKEKLRRIPNVQPGTLTCEHLIKEGTFGRIYAGNLGDSCDILIKTVVDGASLTQVACLLQDAAMLIGHGHPNVLSPMLANTELPGPPEIAYPYPSKGNLKMFLQKSRETNASLSTRQLVEFGLHVSKGLAHLHTGGLVHRDIATRNCYLDRDGVVKLCDSALSRDLFPGDYHCLGDNENRPLKWMALESLQKMHHFTVHSDMWSLGVLFWELATLAQTPFEEVDIFELAHYLADGFRLGQPINCPDEFFTVMSCCWVVDPKQRPSLPQLIAYLEDFHEDLGKYI